MPAAGRLYISIYDVNGRLVNEVINKLNPKVLLLEKPLAISLNEAKRIKKLCESRPNLIVFVKINRSDFFKKIISKVNDFNLPGKNSFLELAPPDRVKQILDGCIPNNSVKAAVTLLFYGDYKNQTRLVLILRNTYNGVHSNQVAFPGGKKEISDLDLKETAIRETIEELGVFKKYIVIQKELTELTQRYSENCLDATNAWDHIVKDASQLEGLPKSALQAAKESAESIGHKNAWRFTLEATSYNTIMSYAKNCTLRKTLWQACHL